MKTKEWGLIKQLSAVGRLKMIDSVGSKAQVERLDYAQIDMSFIYGCQMNDAPGTFTYPLENFGPHKKTLKNMLTTPLILGLQLKGLREDYVFLYVQIATGEEFWLKD
ncbi:hypothetical protein Csa_002358 [Cucumis sativus]|uniref:Uncharacterized protein n=1 Tax=Cucumis sativus TaxID=3659 RepID=A0A0A0LDH1_CUCSA|nr:hypothetical protein Csa_002358 [Cucumis sativus]